MHDHHYLIYADILVHLDGLDAALGVSGDDDTAVGEHIGIQLGDGRPGGAGTGVQGQAGFLCLLFVGIVGLAQPTAEVGVQIIRHAAPGFQ